MSSSFLSDFEGETQFQVPQTSWSGESRLTRNRQKKRITYFCTVSGNIAYRYWWSDYINKKQIAVEVLSGVITICLARPMSCTVLGVQHVSAFQRG